MKGAWHAAPVALATAALGIQSGQWVIAAPLLVLALLSPFVSTRIQADRLAQLAIVLASATFAGFLVPRLFPESGSVRLDQIGSAWFFVASVSMMVAVSRLWLEQPVGGTRTTAAFTLLAIMAAGDVEGGTQAYLILLALWLPLQALASMKDDPTWSASWPLPIGPLIIQLVVAATVAAGFSVLLPRVYDRAMDYFSSYQYDAYTSGFSSSSELGGMSRMLQSDEVVLRVFGKAPTHLRAVIWRSYRAGHWGAGPATPETFDTACTMPEGATEIVPVSSAEGRYFVPIEATQIGVERCLVAAKHDGILEAFGGGTDRLWYVPGPRERFAISPPDDLDTSFPSHDLETKLRELALEWTSGQLDDVGRANVIAKRLRTQYRYSLEYTRPDGPDAPDPLVDFLFTNKQGHCEYFASAMTLMSRSIGIPARMVGGYRVTERNPIGGYHVVRQRNAHAWSEVWLDGAWQTMDATAAAELPMPLESTWGAAIWDAMGAGLNIFWERLVALDPSAAATAVSVLVGIWFLLRRRRRARAAALSLDVRYTDPLPELDVLLSALKSAGLSRAGSEPLETFARRVQPTHPGAAEALLHYAAHRYGSVDTPAQVAERLKAQSAS